MTRVSLLLISAAVSVSLSQLAAASDLPVKAPIERTAVAAPPYSWAGPYVGANIGGAWSNSALTDNATALT